MLSEAMLRRKTRWGEKAVVARAGEVYGLLTVLGRTAYTGNRPRYVCRCACGRVKVFSLFHMRWKAKRGGNPSCGCNVGGKCKAYGVAAMNKLFHWYNRRHGREFQLRRYDFELLVTQPCHYCGKPPSRTISVAGGTLKYNGIDRVANEWGYTPANCITACFECNSMKSKTAYPIFLQRITAIYKHLEIKQ